MYGATVKLDEFESSFVQSILLHTIPHFEDVLLFSLALVILRQSLTSSRGLRSLYFRLP